MYRLKTISNSIICDTASIEYLKFNKNNLIPYVSKDKSGIGILANERIYLLIDPESIELQKEMGIFDKYEHCIMEEISSDEMIEELKKGTITTKEKLQNVTDEVKALQKKTDDQNEQNLIIMTAIADLYEQISTLQEVNQNG